MIRKLLIPGAVSVLFLYTVWNFYSEAVIYDPMSELSVKQSNIRGQEKIISAYKAAWSSEIEEKNLFNPSRTYTIPKPVVVTAPVEPPRRPELVLKGIVADTFGEYVSYIEIDKAKAVSMRRGDKLEGIEVVDISSRKVVLQWNGEKITLSIEKIKTIEKPRMK